MAQSSDTTSPDHEPDKASTNRRRHGRIMLQDIRSSLGPVVDLSASGMRVRTRCNLPKPGQKFFVTLHALESSITIQCTLQWVRRGGLFNHEAGIEFQLVPPDVRRALCDLARSAAYNENMRTRNSDVA